MRLPAVIEFLQHGRLVMGWFPGRQWFRRLERSHPGEVGAGEFDFLYPDPAGHVGEPRRGG